MLQAQRGQNPGDTLRPRPVESEKTWDLTELHHLFAVRLRPGCDTLPIGDVRLTPGSQGDCGEEVAVS